MGEHGESSQPSRALSSLRRLRSYWWGNIVRSLGWMTVVAGTREELAPSPLIPRSTLPGLDLPPASRQKFPHLVSYPSCSLSE